MTGKNSRMPIQLRAGRRAGSPRARAVALIRKHIVTAGLRVGDPLPSYRDFSRRCKASLMTVERAMNDLIREGLIEIVDRKGAFLARQIAPTARTLRTIGLLFAFARPGLVAEPYRSEILHGLLLKADALKADIQIFSFRSENGHILPADVARECDGVIVLGAIRQDALGAFAKEHIPMVLADYLSGDLPLHCLVCDNEATMRSTIARLRANGHTRLAFVRSQQQRGAVNDWAAEDTDSIERRDLFLAAAQAHQADWPDVALPQAGETIQIDRLIEVLAAPNPPTGLVVENTAFARKLIAEIESQTHLRAPRQFSLISLAGAAGENLTPGHVITHHAVRFREMGQRAVERLQQRCRSLRPDKRTVERIGADFCPGDTLGPVPN